MSSTSSPRRIKVLHLAPTLDVGGLEKLQIEFALRGDHERFELSFASLEGGSRVADDLRALGFPVIDFAKPPGLEPRWIPRIARRLRELAVDVLHTHNPGPMIYGAPAARWARVPVVIHTRHHGRDYVVNRKGNALARMVSSLVDRLVCVSDDGRAAAHEEGWSSRRTVTIHNGIDLARFAPRGPVAGGPVIVVARLRPEKAIDRLIDAVALIRRVDPGFRLEIAGDGELDSALREQVERLALGEAVAFLGDVRDVPERLARASALVLPSHTEGISLTLLEAMATGLPVVATRVGGNPEVVVDGETGLLVPPADPPALAEALLRLRRDPELGSAMGARGRERVEQRFDIRRMVADYESTYVEFLERRRAGSARVSTAPKPVSITDSG